MNIVQENAKIYLLIGLLQRWEGNNLELIESMICEVKKDQLSILENDPEKKSMDEIFKEAVLLLEMVSHFFTNSSNS